MALTKMVDGVEVICSKEEERQIRAAWAEEERLQAMNAWHAARKSEYPSMEDQLDLLWHAMDAGEIPVATKFYGLISGIKKKYPKPNSGKG
jgi:hypothetical protein